MSAATRKPGAFVLRRRSDEGHFYYLTPNGGWSPDLSKAKKHSTVLGAVSRRRNRLAEIVSLATAKAAIFAVALLLFAAPVFAQINPPTEYFTNWFKIDVRYATDGVNFTNDHGASTSYNISSNAPWANEAFPIAGYTANPPGAPWEFVTGYPTNLVTCTWSWGHTIVSTNFFTVTNDPGTTMGTLLTFYVYPDVGTNTVYRVYHWHVDGTNATLATMNKLTGTWSWTGSPDYTWNELYLGPLGPPAEPIIRGVSTTGDPLVTTNFTLTITEYFGGHPIKTNVVRYHP